MPAARSNIVAALGLTTSELYPDHGETKSSRKESTEPRRMVAIYDYVDAQGEILYQNVRYEPKTSRHAGRMAKADGSGRSTTLRGCHSICRACSSGVTGEPIFFCEGEKDALRLNELGLLATCHKSLGGEGWRPEWNKHVAGSKAYIFRDNDHTGIDVAEKAASTLHAGKIAVTILALPGLKIHGDVSDWLDQGGTFDELIELAGSELPWQPESDIPPASTIPLFPPFPTDTLPSAMRALCEEASESFGYAPDYVALPALAVIGTMTGGAVEVRIKEGWIERLAFWFVQIGEPGSAKSPAQELALAPVQAIQRDLYSLYKTLSGQLFRDAEKRAERRSARARTHHEHRHDYRGRRAASSAFAPDRS